MNIEENRSDEVLDWLNDQDASEARDAALWIAAHPPNQNDEQRVWVEVWRTETDLIDSIRTQLDNQEDGTIRRTLAWLNDYFTEGESE